MAADNDIKPTQRDEQTEKKPAVEFSEDGFRGSLVVLGAAFPSSAPLAISITLG